MVDIATMTMEAAATEEAIGYMEHSDSGDSELQEQVQKVKVTVSEIQKLTPQLLSAAKMATGKEESSAAAERLNLLSEEWATKVRAHLHKYYHHSHSHYKQLALSSGSLPFHKESLGTRLYYGNLDIEGV